MPFIKIWLKNLFLQQCWIEIAGEYEIQSQSGKVLQHGKKLEKKRLQIRSSGWTLGGDEFQKDRLLIHLAPDAIIKLSDVPYQGDIILQISDDQKIIAINKISIENYIASVIQQQIPPEILNIALLQIHAIMARTQALFLCHTEQKNAFQIASDAPDFNYSGLLSQSNLSKKAVQSTAGMVLLYQNNVFQPRYHFACGGYTTPMEGSPSFFSVCCPHCLQNQDLSWQSAISAATIQQILYRANLITLQEIKSTSLKIQVLQKDEHQRVLSIHLQVGNKVFHLSGWEMAKLFPDNTLPSNYFTMKMIDHGLIFEGRGIGHGMGLCQYGAFALSEKHLPIEILQFYFPGAYVTRLWKEN